MPITLPHRLTRTVLAGLLTFSFALAHNVGAQNSAQSSQASSESAEIQKLIRSGQLDPALQRAEEFLKNKPRDAQVTFLKGLILTEQKKTNEAIAVFSKLTEDFPELPEPYNNLAVLYGGLGQYDKARAALELAIRTDPRYATAYENLGDVYSKLAGQAYDKALQLDGSNAAASNKLALIREMTGASPTQQRPRPAPAVATAATTPPAIANKPSAAAVTTPASSTTPVKPAEPTKPVVAPANADNEEVLEAVKAWANAWSKQDVSAYLASYSKDFKPARRLSRAQWEAERRDRISAKKKIQVEIQQPSITVNGNTAVVTFKQHYRADSLDTTTRKTLKLKKQSERWVILSETAS